MSLPNVNLFNSTPAGRLPFGQVAVLLHPSDDVAIAKVPLASGTILERPDATPLTVMQFIPVGHKLALRDVAQGEFIRRYGQVIGLATAPVRTGEHIHTHNLAVGDFARDYAFCVDAVPVALVPEDQRRTFQGYLRPDGRVGTRNVVTVLASVNCSAHVVREIARHFTRERLAAYPNVDGVIALAHAMGCGVRTGGADYEILQRTIAGMTRHANTGAALMVGLGCETNQINDLLDNYELRDLVAPSLTIQESGGSRKTIHAGIAAVEALLEKANQTPRSAQPVSELVVALKCGGSDSWSGVTANPVLGMLADEVVRQGGTAALAETPEIYGAEHLLTRRAISREVGEQLVEKVRWWERHAVMHETDIDNNPSAGNKVGGLTTIFEKSLGAVAKGGTSPLMGVFDYAAPITQRGFVFVDTPGFDPVCVTGQVASGCNVVIFTTGRGSVFGFKPAPSIKVTSNSAVFAQMPDDMDFNAGRVLDGEDPQATASALFDLMVAVASGQQTKSEEQDIGEDEYNPWNLGGTL
ncbi:MAG: altronate dehydratase [Chloroflexi bacterium]|nr:altronate dehydratase [Chloroflexota bacterium]